MILKELDSFQSTDRFHVAGRKAEEQMAFYLRRHFKSAMDVFVINGLRLWMDGETAQIDHLVIHPTGLIIIESKSVAEKICITNDLQWIRQYGEKQVGMKSPIIQAKMQGTLLSELIELFAKPAQHLAENIVTLVAISDNGIIEWPDSGPLEGVKKADQICEQIIRIANESYTPEDALISYEDMLKRISPATMTHEEVVTRGWWALLCTGFLVDCDTLYADIKKQVHSDSVEISVALYNLAWQKNMTAGLGDVDAKVRENQASRLSRLRLESAKRRQKLIPIIVKPGSRH